MTQKITKARTRNEDSVKNCQVIELGIGDFAECAQWGPVTCEHAMPFGYTFLCMHPRVKDMIENTRKNLSAAKT
jgi:hypothetical protein